MPLDATGHDPASGRSSRTRLDARGPAARCRRSCADTRPVAGGEHGPRQSPARHPGPRACARLVGDVPPHRPEGYPAPVVWLGIGARPGSATPRASRSAPASSSSDGLLDEAAALRARYPEDLRAFGAMGYREAFDVLAGRATLDEAIATDVSGPVPMLAGSAPGSAPNPTSLAAARAGSPGIGAADHRGGAPPSRILTDVPARHAPVEIARHGRSSRRVAAADVALPPRLDRSGNVPGIHTAHAWLGPGSRSARHGARWHRRASPGCIDGEDGGGGRPPAPGRDSYPPRVSPTPRAH